MINLSGEPWVISLTIFITCFHKVYSAAARLAAVNSNGAVLWKIVSQSGSCFYNYLEVYYNKNDFFEEEVPWKNGQL